jgi:hypothetical protein
MDKASKLESGEYWLSTVSTVSYMTYVFFKL